MIICTLCGKEIKENAYPSLQVVLGNPESPAAADPSKPYHKKCMEDNIDNLVLTTYEKKQALEMLATL
jgi:hypothetical protein